MRGFYKRAVSEWTLKLGGIPLSNQGQEVILQFYSSDIDNNKTFYTDSNGLEMQQRILDYRPTWDFVSVMNVTQNYFPVNSAITIVDNANMAQITIMTPRSQGGSSLSKGTIEVMHQRRLYYDDSRGVGEPLNETDEYGNGIQVTSTYYFQILNRTYENSL